MGNYRAFSIEAASTEVLGQSSLINTFLFKEVSTVVSIEVLG